jgi:chromosome segregation ATPase
LGVDRETVLIQVLAAYRATAELDDGLQGPQVDVAAEVADAVDARLDSVLDEHIDRVVREAAERQADDATAEAAARIDEVEADFREKIEDVRKRVIQVKRETDAKAPADHDHEEFERVGDLATEMTELGDQLDDLEERVDEALEEQEESVDEVTDRLDTVEERLQTVAWVVRDLRERVESDAGLEAVDRIKRAAAKADIDRAKCESCGSGVEVALLTEPKCPHCDATVTDVKEASSFFSKPKLLVASQLESGERR